MKKGFLRRLSVAAIFAGTFIAGHAIINTPASQAHVCARVDVKVVFPTVVKTDDDCWDGHNGDDFCLSKDLDVAYVLVCEGVTG